MMPEHSSSFTDDDGWIIVRCSCGFEFGPVPDWETAADVWGDHSASTAVADLTADDLVRLAAERAPDDEPHIIKFDENGWVMRHPLRCRLGDLFACPYSEAAARQIVSRRDRIGEYQVVSTIEDPDDHLVLGTLPTERTTDA